MIDPKLGSICDRLSNDLMLAVQGLDKSKFLLSISGVESSFGKNLGPRFEPAYAPEGRYFTNDDLKKAYEKYGKFAASSFGPWQILYISAHELGFDGHPEDLLQAEVSGPFVVKKLNRFGRNGANSVERLLDAWNTGNWKTGQVPLEYISQFWGYYNQLLKGEIA